MTWKRNLHWIVCIVFLSSCARQSSPTGGPKDTIPPVLKSVIPKDETINFKSKELQLLFSEDIILNTPKEQLIITPTIGKEYEITARKNTVSISFKEPLKDSTTYTFNFRETVQDITEKNPVENLQVAFSTGSYIDSLSISGTVFDLLKGKELSESTVALHEENDTFNIFQHAAVYFTKTDKEGKFKLSHLKPENYFIYAFDDKNRNLSVDSRTEYYGFEKDYLYLIENIGDISIGVIRLDARPLNMTSARPYNTYFNIRTTKNIRTFKISAIDSTDLSYTFGEDNANIRLYKTTDKDSLHIRFVAVDSLDNVMDTTLYAKFLEREVKPEKFDINILSASIIAEKGQIDAKIAVTKPVEEINFDSIFFLVDSLRKIPFTAKDVHYDPLRRIFTISKKVDKSFFTVEEKSPTAAKTGPQAQPKDAKGKTKKTILNELVLGKGAFLSIENDSSASVNQNVKPLKEADLSIINIEIKTAEKFYIAELLDSKFEIIRTYKNKPKLRFEDVKPGEYQLRLIIDSNQNGRWDPGNYQKKTEPEDIVYYRTPDGSTIIKGAKANWDIGAGEMFITY